MNAKIRPPCRARHRKNGKVYQVRAVNYPNTMMQMSGWKGLVCVCQNRNGTTLVEYGMLEKIDERKSVK